MKTEFTIFRVKKGMESRAEEWMGMLSARKADCVATLDHEAMYCESIFKSYFGNQMFLAWYSVQGDIHGEVDDSEHEIDNLHCAFWNECIDTDWKPINMEHVVSFASPSIDDEIARIDAMGQHKLSQNKSS